MARTTSTNYSTPSFSKATVDEDPFDANDVQQLAAAVDGHDHTTGKGVAVALADSAVTNVKLASDTARANLLTNGGFEVWQRGNGPFTTTGTLSADQWSLSVLAGNGSLSVSRDTTNTDSSPAAAACVRTHTGTPAYLYQIVEGVQQLRGRVVTFSVRVRCSTANAIRARVYNDTAEVLGTIHSGSGTWETLSVTVTVPSNATILYPSVSMFASATSYIDNAMLVVGSVAADYAPLHPADDLARCQRYYEALGGTTAAIVAQWSAVAAYADARWVGLGTRKAVTPTVTKVGTWTVSSTGQPSVGGATTQGFYITSLATGAANAYYQCADATTYISVEANP